MPGAYGPRAIEQLQRAIVAAARARRAIQPRHGLDVVIEHVGPRVEHDAQRRFVALEIRDQHFDAGTRDARARLGDRPREVRGAAIRQVVAIDRGDDDVVELHAWMALATLTGSCASGGFGVPCVTLQ